MTAPKNCNHEPGDWLSEKRGGYKNWVIVGYTLSRGIEMVLVKCRRCRQEFELSRRGA